MLVFGMIEMIVIVVNKQSFDEIALKDGVLSAHEFRSPTCVSIKRCHVFIN